MPRNEANIDVGIRLRRLATSGPRVDGGAHGAAVTQEGSGGVHIVLARDEGGGLLFMVSTVGCGFL